MQIPNDLRQAALAAYHRGDRWQAFVREHHDAITAASPYNQAEYHKLRSILIGLVTAGNNDGLFGIGDDDAIPWLADDAADQPDDVQTNARYRGPLPITQTTVFDVSDQYR